MAASMVVPAKRSPSSPNNGTEALLVYPIEPIRPLDDLTANVSVMSAPIRDQESDFGFAIPTFVTKRRGVRFRSSSTVRVMNVPAI